MEFCSHRWHQGRSRGRYLEEEAGAEGHKQTGRGNVQDPKQNSQKYPREFLGWRKKECGMGGQGGHEQI